MSSVAGKESVMDCVCFSVDVEGLNDVVSMDHFRETLFDKCS